MLLDKPQSACGILNTPLTQKWYQVAGVGQTSSDPGGFRKWENMLRKLASLFTIRFTLVAMLVVLGGIIGYYTIGLTRDAIAKRDNALIAVDASLIAENSLKAADALASEREYTVRALGIGSFMGVIDSALGKKALGYRAEAQQAMAAVIASADSESAAGSARSHLSALARSNAALGALRGKVDAALQTGGMLDDRELSDEWWPAVSETIILLRQLRVSTVFRPDGRLDFPPRFARIQELARVQEAVWAIAEHTAGEREIIARAISSAEPLSR
ncbi:MAG: hypothetical protein IMF05_04055, partial [Proteobacteria bacterium]|nr:hypothetical protein [Pseudomonadota bacterium]